MFVLIFFCISCTNLIIADDISVSQFKFVGYKNVYYEGSDHQVSITLAEVFYNVNYINVNYSVKNSTVDCKYLLLLQDFSFILKPKKQKMPIFLIV